MSLSRRQAAAINQIIQEEVQGAMKGRKQRDEFLRRGEIQERLVEAPAVDAMRVDWSIMDERVEAIVEEIGNDMVDEFLYKFRQKLLRRVASEMSQHGMSQIRIDPRTFPAEVEEFDDDGVYGSSMEANTDIRSVLTKYARDLGQLAVHMAGGREADDEEFDG